MDTINIPGFKGGIANSKFDTLDHQTFQSARDLDVFSSTNTIRPSVGLTNDIGIPANFHPMNSWYASDNKIYFLGEHSSPAVPNLYSTSALSTSSTYALVSSLGANNSNWPLEEYADKLYWGAGANLYNYGNLSGTPTVGIPQAVTTGVNLLRNHYGLGLLFYVHNTQQTIGRYDGTTYDNSRFTSFKDDRIVAIEPYGQYLMIGVNSVNGSRKSRIYQWDGSGLTVQDVIWTGEGTLQTMRVMNGFIYAVVVSNQRLRVYKIRPGWPFEPSVNINFNSTGTTPTVNNEAMDVLGNVAYFGLYGHPTLDIPYGIFGFGNNDPTQISYMGSSDFLNIDRLVHTGDTTNHSITSLRLYGKSGDIMVVTWTDGSSWYINHNLSQAAGVNNATTNGTYETNNFPLDVYGQARLGRIKTITVNHRPLVSSLAGITINHKSDQESAWVTVGTNNAQGSVKTRFQTETRNGTIQGFPQARFEQLQVLLTPDNTNSSTRQNQPEIVFPITVDVDVTSNV